MISSNASLLPKEVTALVHHVELNRAGWWEKGVQRLVLAAVWLSDHTPNIDEIQNMLKRDFCLQLKNGKLNAALSGLENQKLLIQLQDGSYRIPDNKRVLFEQEIEASEKVATDARDYFISLINERCDKLDPQNAWNEFESKFLAPLIKEVGSNAYYLIAGKKMVADKRLVDHFLKQFDPAFHRNLRELVTVFLDPKKDEVRAYISRMLHARFCVEASGLTETIIDKINETVGKQVQYRVFVDTNFLFSLLDLHDNPSNAAARELQELITQLKSNLKIQLFIIPPTVQEAMSSIASAKFNLSGIPAGTNFTQAALKDGFSGMAKRFFEERLRRGIALSAEDWFDPYLKDFVAIARGKNIEFFNEDLSSYSTRQDVVDDLHLVLDSEKRRPQSRRKSYEKVAHDMTLWHFANDKRPAHIESPIDARDWILTVDFRLIGFDEHKNKKSESKIPLCLHPTSLIQLLQFWVPRTKEFEEAMLGSMRLPFLFQEFDIEAERTSLKILKGLGKFEGRDDISEQTITRIMINDGLRSRLKSEHPVEAEEEIALIRDALIEELRARAEDEAKKTHKLQDELQARADDDAKKTQQLQNELLARESVLSTLDSEMRSKSEEIQSKNSELERLRNKVAEEESRSLAAGEKLIAQSTKMAELKTSLEISEESKKRQSALIRYVGLLALLIIMSGVVAWQVDRLLLRVAEIIGKIQTKAIAAAIVFVVGHLLLELSERGDSRMTSLWPFIQTRKFRKWLWSMVILGLVFGVAVNLYSNQIQKTLDHSAPQTVLPNVSVRPNSGNSAK